MLVPEVESYRAFSLAEISRAERSPCLLQQLRAQGGCKEIQLSCCSSTLPRARGYSGDFDKLKQKHAEWWEMRDDRERRGMLIKLIKDRQTFPISRLRTELWSSSCFWSCVWFNITLQQFKLQLAYCEDCFSTQFFCISLFFSFCLHLAVNIIYY